MDTKPNARKLDPRQGHFVPWSVERDIVFESVSCLVDVFGAGRLFVRVQQPTLHFSTFVLHCLLLLLRKKYAALLSAEKINQSMPNRVFRYICFVHRAENRI